MKKVAIGVVALMLAAVSALGISINTFAEHYDENVEIEGIIGDDLPDDLSIKMESIYADDVQNGFIAFHLGNDVFNEYQEDYEIIMAKYQSCYDEEVTPKEQKEACKEEANTLMAEACVKYGFFVQMPFFKDIYLMSNDELYEYEDGNITINAHLTDYDEIYEGITSGMEEMGYSGISFEPLVIHKKHDGSYEYVDADYEVETNSLRFTVNELSAFMITYAFSIPEEESESPATFDNMEINVITAAIGIVGLFTFGLFMAKKERR